MAFQGYRHKSDKTVGENEASPTKVAGHPEMTYHDGTSNKTPAPVREVSTTDLARSTSWGRSMGDPGDNSSKQGYGGASSLSPGERSGPATISASAPVDAVKDALVSGGAKGAQRSDDWQTRSQDFTSEQADPTAKGMRSRNNEGGIVPKKIGASILDNSAARRAAMLRIGQGK
jgi:hypothetical protein